MPPFDGCGLREIVGKDLQSLAIDKLLYDKQSMDIMGSMSEKYKQNVDVSSEGPSQEVPSQETQALFSRACQ
jgi:hypothetical protein